MAQSVDVGDGLTARDQHRRHVPPDLAAVITRDETTSRQRRRQAVGQPNPVSQQPDRDSPGQRHHTITVGGD
jgi:hypothetical protein